jgi:hypothetical protein
MSPISNHHDLASLTSVDIYKKFLAYFIGSIDNSQNAESMSISLQYVNFSSIAMLLIG